MHTTIRAAALTAAIALGFAINGCSADIHDNTVNVDAKLDFNANVTEGVKPGQSVAVTMNATGVVLVEPNTEPPAAEADKACYFKIFLDDVDSDPLLVTAQVSAQIKIPEGTSEGKHNLICRLHKHDGTPTTQEQQVIINVSASATVTSGGDAG